MVKSRMRMVGVLSSIILAALPFGLSGCFESDAPKTGASPTSAVPSVEPAPPATPSGDTTDPIAAAEPQVYWLRSEGKKLELSPVKVTIEVGNTPSEKLKATVERLLKGPANADVTSSIPDGTKLNSLKVERDGVHVDLNKAFTSGGGSTSMQGRLGQVIYTASCLNPTEPVWISVEGEPLSVLGGEGLEVPQPMTRDDFKKGFSL
ncbi:GerMN domain-containing protein [Altericista sp. CCNU0014]|uniref:GerMN domain-containing protein n=1 Tax=Altericista sp. CCNU0014 TaxID=3082949 RepID=UPI00384F24CD